MVDLTPTGQGAFEMIAFVLDMHSWRVSPIGGCDLLLAMHINVAVISLNMAESEALILALYTARKTPTESAQDLGCSHTAIFYSTIAWGTPLQQGQMTLWTLSDTLLRTRGKVTVRGLATEFHEGKEYHGKPCAWGSSPQVIPEDAQTSMEACRLSPVTGEDQEFA